MIAIDNYSSSQTDNGSRPIKSQEARDRSLLKGIGREARQTRPPQKEKPGSAWFHRLPEDNATRAETTFFRWLRAEWSETWLVNHLSTNEISV